MLFNSAEFLIFFFPITITVYYLCPKKWRYLWLVAASYYFYMQWNAIYILLLFFCTTVTYRSGLILEKLKREEKENGKRKQRCCLAAAVLLLLGQLGFYKYSGFGLDCINLVLKWMRMDPIGWKPSILLPVGISFYTLQALGYLIDVYRGEIYAERNFFRYALFLSFFPQLVAGPIERSKNLLVQLNKPQSFSYENLRKGFVLMLYGLFCKMVIADRAAILVDTVYDNDTAYSGFAVLLAVLLFTFQIYCDFYGYSTIARGAALVMGIRLMDNFNAPYFSGSVKEFWRRWHISLSLWFRDYLYIPLGGSRRGKLRREGNLMTVFAVSGLWHGAAFSYIAWGLLHGIYQVAEDMCRMAAEAGKRRKQAFYRKWLGEEEAEMPEAAERGGLGTALLRRLLTFCLVSFAWMFFRMGSIRDTLHMAGRMLAFDFHTLADGSLYTLGLSKGYLYVLAVSVIVLLGVDCKKYKGIDMADALLRQEWWFRIAVHIALIVSILLFGCYGAEYDTQQFIYFQF